jgi:hypothetical protein
VTENKKISAMNEILETSGLHQMNYLPVIVRMIRHRFPKANTGAGSKNGSGRISSARRHYKALKMYRMAWRTGALFILGALVVYSHIHR